MLYQNDSLFCLFILLHFSCWPVTPDLHVLLYQNMVTWWLQVWVEWLLARFSQRSRTHGEIDDRAKYISTWLYFNILRTEVNFHTKIINQHQVTECELPLIRQSDMWKNRACFGKRRGGRGGAGEAHPRLGTTM